MELGGSSKGSKRSCLCILLVILLCGIPLLAIIAVGAYFATNPDLYVGDTDATVTSLTETAKVSEYPCKASANPHSCVCPGESV